MAHMVENGTVADPRTHQLGPSFVIEAVQLDEDFATNPNISGVSVEKVSFSKKLEFAGTHLANILLQKVCM